MVVKGCRAPIEYGPYSEYINSCYDVRITELKLDDVRETVKIEVVMERKSLFVVEENEVFELEEVDHEDFDSGSELDEGVRRKALRKVSRMNKAKVTIWKENFFVGEQGQVPDFANNNMGSVLPVTSDPKGPTSIVKPKSISKKEKVTKPKGSYGCPWAMQVSKFPNEDTWEVKILEDTHKCLQSRIVNKCIATFLSRELEESIKPNPKIPLNALKDQLQKKFEV
ncbi:hypothetical protein Tco_0662275 [Tanacetum coccineum]